MQPQVVGFSFICDPPKMELALSLFTLLAFTLLVIVLFKWLPRVYDQYVFWKRKGVPGFSGIPILGSGWKILLRRISIPAYFQKVYNLNTNARYIGLIDFTLPAFVVRDPELIKDIAVKSFEHFTDHRAFVDENVDPVFGKNVFSLKGERWREMRNTLSPSFTTNKMKFLFELVSKCSQDFVKYLDEHPDFSSSIELKDAFSRYTNDVIATSAFGISVNSLQDRENEFFLRGKDATSFSSVTRMVKIIIVHLLPKLSKMLGLTFLTRGTMRFFQNVVSETVRVREEQGIVRPDMIHLLIQARDQDKLATHHMTIDDIIAQAFIFFFAGFDTSSTLMCFLVQELAVNPDIQERLREEVDKCVKEANGDITYDTLSGMEYMDMVISEALRKYPPLIFVDRVCVKEYILPPALPGNKSVTIEPGVMAWFPVYALHHDPKYFPDPEKFDPERFNQVNKDNIDPYTYLPFGIGPRKCIGNRFALMETKILIAHLLQKFYLKPTKKTTHPIQFSMHSSITLNSKSGFWVGLEKRAV